MTTASYPLVQAVDAEVLSPPLAGQHVATQALAQVSAYLRADATQRLVEHFVPTAAAAAASMDPEDAALVAPPIVGSSSHALDGPYLQPLSPFESLLEQRVQTSAVMVVAKLLRLNADTIWPPPPLPPPMIPQPLLSQGAQQQRSWGQRTGGFSQAEEHEHVQARGSLNRRRADATTMRICERLPRIPHRIVSRPLVLRRSICEHAPAEGSIVLT
jgi:hypothetical protein